MAKDTYKAIIDMAPDGRWSWEILNLDNELVNQRGNTYFHGSAGEIALLGNEATKNKAIEAATLRLDILRRYLDREEPTIIT